MRIESCASAGSAVGFVAVDEITNRVGGMSLVMKVDLLRKL